LGEDLDVLDLQRGRLVLGGMVSLDECDEYLLSIDNQRYFDGACALHGLEGGCEGLAVLGPFGVVLLRGWSARRVPRGFLVRL